MSEAQPALLILGGINGAGKSTLAQIVAARPRFRGVPFLNPDVAAARFRVEDPSRSLNTADYLGLREVALEIRHLIADRTSFVTETVLASASYRNICREAQAAGYTVHLLYVGIPAVEHSIARVALRVAKGGHHVSEADIRRRWPATHDNLAWFAQHADEVDVFDNSGNGQPPRLIATARAGTVTLLDRDALPEVTRALAKLAGGCGPEPE